MQDLIRGSSEHKQRSHSGKDLISTLAGQKANTVVAISKTTGADISEVEQILETNRVSAMPAIAGLDYQTTILWMASRIAAGLAFAHEHGVFHGDMKPANILISDDGHPLILDFHLAVRPASVDDLSLVGGTLPSCRHNTCGSLSGTQIVDPSCDIFSVGVILYESLTGRLFPYPNRGNDSNPIEQMMRDRAVSPRPVRMVNPNVSPGTPVSSNTVLIRPTVIRRPSNCTSI